MKTIIILSILIGVNVIIAYFFPFPLAIVFIFFMVGLAMSSSPICFPLYHAFVPLILILGLILRIYDRGAVGRILCILGGVLTLPMGILGIIAGFVDINLPEREQKNT